MKNAKILLSVALIILAGLALSLVSYQNKIDLEYRESLDETIVTVDENALTLRDLTYYIVKQELFVENQAKIYDIDNTNTYWGLRLKRTGGFVKLEAKQAIIDAAVHDEIFYQMARAEEIVLDEEETEKLLWMQYDFWADLEETQVKRLGVDRKDVNSVMERIAIAQKYQRIYTPQHHTDSGYFDVGEEGYIQLLEEHRYKVNESVWKRIPFGNIIVDHGVRED